MRHFEKTMALILAAGYLLRLTTGCSSGGFGERPKLANVGDDGQDWGEIGILFDISDADRTESRVVVEYYDGADWQPATLVGPTRGRAGPGAVRALWPTKDGISVTVNWDTWADGVQLGGLASVEVRLSSFDVDGAGDAQTIFVNVNNLHPVLSTVESELVFPDGVLGLQDPTDQTLTIENAGTGGAPLLQWTITGIAYRESVRDWLSQPTSAGGIPAGSSEVVTFQADCLTAPPLPRGEYHATITIEDANAHESPIEIPVRLVVRDQMAGIYIHDGSGGQVTDLAFDYSNGVLTPPLASPHTFYVENSGEVATQLDWQLSDDTGSAAWLSYPLGTSGTNLGSTLSDQVEVTITDPGSMDPGEHTATITVTGNKSGTSEPPFTGDQTVTVTLNVDFPPIIVHGPGSFAFYGVYGMANPDSHQLSITNTGDRTLTWTITDDAGGWLAVSPAGGTLVSGESVSPALGVSVDMYWDSPPMDANTYAATITITGKDPGGAPAENDGVTIPVTLVIFTF